MRLDGPWRTKAVRKETRVPAGGTKTSGAAVATGCDVPTRRLPLSHVGSLDWRRWAFSSGRSTVRRLVSAFAHFMCVR